MTVRFRFLLRSVSALAVTTSLALLAGCASSASPKPSLAAANVPAAKPPARVYRLVFLVQKHTENAPDTTGQYLMNVQEGRGVEIAIDAQAQVEGHPRTDTGVKLSGSCDAAGDDLFFHGGLELTAVEPGQVLRRVRAHGDALLTPQKPALLATLADPETGSRYDVTVTATRQR